MNNDWLNKKEDQLECFCESIIKEGYIGETLKEVIPYNLEILFPVVDKCLKFDLINGFNRFFCECEIYDMEHFSLTINPYYLNDIKTETAYLKEKVEVRHFNFFKYYFSKDKKPTTLYDYRGEIDWDKVPKGTKVQVKGEYGGAIWEDKYFMTMCNNLYLVCDKDYISNKCGDYNVYAICKIHGSETIKEEWRKQ